MVEIQKCCTIIQGNWGILGHLDQFGYATKSFTKDVTHMCVGANR